MALRSRVPARTARRAGRPASRLLFALLATLVCALVGALVGAGPASAAPPRPYLVPWIAVSPGDPLPPPAPPDAAGGSINAPGILVEAWGGTLAAETTPGAIAQAFAAARLAGRKTGLSFDVPELPVPSDAREAEAASAGSLLPGFDAAIAAAHDADLLVLSLPDLPDDVRARRYLLMKVAAEVRARAPAARVAVLFHQPRSGTLFPKAARELLSEEAAAYVDVLGLDLDDARAEPAAVRAAADELAFARPLLVRTPRLADAAALLWAAARFSAVDAPFVAAPLASTSDAPLLDRLGSLLVGDFGRDGRASDARTASGGALEATRLAPAADLGAVVVLPGFAPSGAEARGPLVLELEAPDYVSADVVELATGRSRRFAIPKTAAPPKLTLSTANGPIAVVLAPREKPKEEAARAAAAVTAVRGITVEEILAKHQVWRAARDARWTRFVGTNRTSIRFRFEGLDNSFELSFEGPLFYEKGKGFDWAWSTAYVNGVRWRGKKFPTLPLLQPEKVSELPLTLTFNDAYRYELEGDTTVAGLPCWKLKFEPKASTSVEPLYAGTVYIAQTDFSVRRVDTRQLNLTGEVQSADETTDFGEVPAPDGRPLLLPVRTRGQWIVKTFSRTTTLERYTELTGVSIDPPDFEARKKAVSSSDSVMVRDTDQGIRYLEKNKEGERVVVEDTKTAKLFGLGGVFYDDSYDYPLPLLGVYYIDLDVAKKKRQLQVFFAGVILAGSYNDPSLFGTKLDLGVDAFGSAVRGSDTLYVDGTEDKAQTVKSRGAAANLNVGYPVARHLKLTGTVGATYRDYAEDSDTAPGFAVPSDHWVTRLEGRAAYDLQGWSLTGRYGWSFRSRWEPWGYPGNPDYDPGKDRFQQWEVRLSKDFRLPRFQRIRGSVSWVGTRNADRFSKITFGFYGGSSLRGFRSGSLRAEEAVVARGAYGFVFGDVFRLEGIYEHAVVKDPASGLDWANFGGAGISGQFSGPWSTLVQLDAGLPVVGRERGQTGFVLNLVFLKSF